MGPDLSFFVPMVQLVQFISMGNQVFTLVVKLTQSL